MIASRWYEPTEREKEGFSRSAQSTEEEGGREIQALSVSRPLRSPSVCSVVEKEMVLAARHWRGGSGVRIYHLCDVGAISTRRLVEVLAEGMDKPARLLSLPRWAAMTAGTLLGKGAQVRRLYGNLEVDGSDFCRDYNWRPPLSLEDGLREMARSFVDGEKA